MARKRGEWVAEKFPEPELLPIMNIIFMLILALVSMAALLPLGVITSEAQKIAKGGAFVAQEETETKKPLNLIVFITETGFNISVRGDVKMGEADPLSPGRKLPLVPKREKDQTYLFDFVGLQEKLTEFKALDQDELSMTITADPEIETDIIIKTMDAARFDKDRKPLFPKVSFAAGLVG